MIRSSSKSDTEALLAPLHRSYLRMLIHCLHQVLGQGFLHLNRVGARTHAFMFSRHFPLSVHYLNQSFLSKGYDGIY